MKAYALYGPPGTGKTTETINRIQNRIDDGARARDISLITFTKAAAAEAVSRIGAARHDKFGTMHSALFKLCGLSPRSVIDGWKLRAFGAKIGIPVTGSIDTDNLAEAALGDKYHFLFGVARNRVISLREAYYSSDRPGAFDQFEFFCKAYTEYKKANGLIDFTDFLDTYIASPVPHGSRYLFIDEAQDLSPLQWQVIERMASFPSVEEVHIAGDDDQAIFEWSGADPHGMAKFSDKHDADVTVLDQSWRVPRKPHAMALDLIGRVKNRVPKEYKSREHDGEVERAAEFDVRMAGDRRSLILCRSFVTRNAIEEELVRHRVGYKVEGNRPGLFNSRWADAIRVFNKLAAGLAVSQNDLEKMSLVADTKTKQEIASKDFKPMMKRGALRSFTIPPELLDYFEEVDLEQKANITLSTIHSAKGRESENVIIHLGMTERTIVDNENNPEAEARVWYVALTRTSQKMTLIDGDMPYDI